MAPGYKPAIMAVLENFVDLLAGACMHYVLPWPARCLALNVCLPLRDRQCSECCSEELGRRCTCRSVAISVYFIFRPRLAKNRFPYSLPVLCYSGTRYRVPGTVPVPVHTNRYSVLSIQVQVGLYVLVRRLRRTEYCTAYWYSISLKVTLLRVPLLLPL